jgi:hypothetical protein
MSSEELDLLYHSYFSIITTADSDSLSTGGSDEQANVFLASNYSSFSANEVSSPDIEFNSTTGRITAKATGTYLLVYIPTITVAGGVGVAARINRNGTNEVALENLVAFSSTDPISATCHRILDLTAGDYIELTIAASSTTAIQAQNGTSFTMLKANGDYASLAQSADGSAGTANALEVIGDQDLAGSGNIATNLKNINYSSGTGLLTPANTRPFLLLASLMGDSDTTSEETAIEIYANGSLIDGGSALIHSGNDTNEESYGLLKTLTGGQTVSGRYRGGNSTAITTKKGTSFSVLDLSSNNGAGTPSAFISFAVAADSDSQGAGDSNAFDEDNWTSYSTTTHSAATGITYTSSDGTFVVSNSGKYLILWNLFVGTATFSVTRDVKILKNGSTVYTTPLMVHTSFDPDEKTVCVILDADAGDSFTFVVNKLRGKIDNGTSITMVKIDDLKDLHLQSIPTDSLIADDFTINSFSAQGLSPQHDRAGTEQVPFALGVRGPMSLRGRRLVSTAPAPNVSTGQKKN